VLNIHLQFLLIIKKEDYTVGDVASPYVPKTLGSLFLIISALAFRLLERKNISNKLTRRITRKITTSIIDVIDSNPLPSEMPSPELGAGPGLLAVTTFP
jgi:phosphoribosylaminoimidazole-succinocarboxamide synthase